MNVVDDIEQALLARQGKWKGKELFFVCPCHDDHHPSGRWNPQKQCWHCFVCGKGGGRNHLMKQLGLLSKKNHGQPPSSNPLTFSPPRFAFDWRRMSSALEFASEHHSLRAERIFKAARQCEVSAINDEALNKAWKCLSVGFHSLRVSENLGIIAFQIRVNGLADEAQRHCDRKVTI